MMKCLATTKKQNMAKIKHRSADDAIEFVVVVMSYVLIECFKYGQDKVTKIHEKIEWYASICLDKDEDVNFETYLDILRDDYNYSLDYERRNVAELAKGEKIEALSQDSAILWILSIIAYLFFDKFGLNEKRISTIMKRIEYYISIVLDSSKKLTLQSCKDILKDKHDFEIEREKTT